jgi:phosphoglycolate phosphatase-like HAD superfamily hydrolase
MQIPSMGNSKDNHVPSLTTPEVRRVWVPEKIEGNTFVEGHYMYVLTSNDKAFVQRFLDAFDINCFEDIYSEMNIFGKAEALKKFMKLQGISAPDMLYVGDEVRDIDACRKNKVTIVSVSWGFNTEDKLKEHSPDEIVKSPDDLHAAIKKLSE